MTRRPVPAGPQGGGTGAGAPVSLRIVALAPNAWHGTWMNRQHLLSRLARQHRVVYSNGLWASWDRARPAFRTAPLRAHVEAADGVLLHQRGRLPIRVPRVPPVDRVALRLGARTMRRVAGGAGPLVAYLFHPEFLPYVEPLRPDFVVYHAYDLFRLMRGGEHLRSAEDRLLESADLVIATSDETARDFRTRSSAEVHVLGNGVDGTPFAAAGGCPLPEELQGIPEPRVGYVGRVNEKVDLELLARLAARRPDWSIVVVGEWHRPGTTGDLEARLAGLPNVHVVGPVAQWRVPAFLAHVDVGLLPYRLDTWAVAASPLKLFEYLAAGLPAVASDIPAVRPFAGVVDIAGTPQDWERAIADAIGGRGPGDRDARVAVARDNSWDHRVAVLSGLLQDMASGRG